MISIDLIPLWYVVGASLYLASKLEESPRRLREIITVLDSIEKEKSKNPEILDISSQKYFELREGLLDAEVLMLAKLAFNVHVEHPHGFLLNYLSSLDLVKQDGFAQHALNLLNDW
jgi:cyclin L